MPRPTWKGSLSFGLVNVPVKAYTAVRDHRVHFHQLQKRTGARIRNQRVSDTTGKKVEADDIEMGYELRKGKYVTFERSELEELQPASTRAVEITDFVPLADIDPMFYERTYWLAPADDQAKEAYVLLHAAMEERQRVGIGTVVMRNTQYLTAIRPVGTGLAMSTMHFADEVQPQSDVDGLPTRRSKPDAKTLKLATQIVDSLDNDWDPERYHDTYTEELEKIIAKKAKGEKLVEEAEAPEEESDFGDLMAALEASVSERKSRRQARTAKRSPAKRSATKRPATKKAAAKRTGSRATSRRTTRAKK